MASYRTLILVALVLVSFYAVSDLTREEPTPVILVSMDTLRADRVTAQGYERNITPNLDRFINSSSYYSEAYANGAWTLPSHSSIFTGRYPSDTGTFSWKYRLCNSSTTLSEIAREEGYRTVSYNGGAGVSSRLGLDQGFQIYDEQKHVRLYNGTFKEARKWLETRETDRFFLFAHGYDVHAPYVTPDDLPMRYGEKRQDFLDSEKELKGAVQKSNLSEYQAYFDRLPENWTEKDRKHIVNLYDTETYYMDQGFGRFIRSLKEEGIYREALIIVISDHGEELGDHGKIVHGHSRLYDEVLRSLMAVKYPGQKEPRRIKSRVTLRRLYPTIKHYLGRDTQMETLREYSQRENSTHFSENARGKVVYKDGYKLKWRFGYDNGSLYELYNLEEDPGENDNLAKTEKSRLKALNKSFRKHPSRNSSTYCLSDIETVEVD